MARLRQHIRNTRAILEAGTMRLAEYAFDTTLNSIRMGDGATLGGHLVKKWGRAYKIAPPQITSNQNDYNPTDLSIAEHINLTSNGAYQISGLAGGSLNRELTLRNKGSFVLYLLDQGAGSIAANRFDFGGDFITLRPGDAVKLHYDDVASRWGRASGGGKVSRIPEELMLSGQLTPPQITANQNDYTPTDGQASTVLRLSTDASRNITGLFDPRPGAIKIIINVGANPIVLKNADVASTATNRFDFGADVTLFSRQAVLIEYDGTDARWKLVSSTAGASVADGAVVVRTLGSSALNSFGCMINGTIVQSRSGNAETIAIKTLAGTDPSASDPVIFVFRNAVAASGDYVVRLVTAAMSLTISSGSSMGFSSGVAARLWYVVVDTGAGLVLGAINCVANGKDIYPLSFGYTNTTAEGGAGAADSAHVVYTAAAQATKPFIPIGFATWETGLATAGTWNTAPGRIQLVTPGTLLPGQCVQRVRTDDGAMATGTTTIPIDNTIPQNTEGDQYITRAITPTSAANVLAVRSQLIVANSNVVAMVAALFQDSVANALKTVHQLLSDAGAIQIFNLEHVALAAGSAGTTFRIRAGGNAAGTTTYNGLNGSALYNGTFNSFLQVEELQG